MIEACLQLLDEGLVVGIQDLGGAGLTCATSETASRGGVGMDVDVSAVPRREPGMEPWEVMTSESQERMLAIVTPDAATGCSAVCRPVGGAGDGGRSGHRHRTAADPRRLGRRGAGRHPGRHPPRGRPDLPPAHGGAGRSGRPPGRRPRGPARRPARTAAPTCWRLLVDPSWVLPPIRPSAVPEHRGGARRRRRPAAAGRARGRRHWSRRGRGVWPCRRTETAAGAPSTRGPAPPWSWRSRPSTWRAWAPGPWPSSTASTSETRSTPKSCGSCRRRSTGWPRPAGRCRSRSSAAMSACTTRAGAATSIRRPVVGTLGLVERPRSAGRPGIGLRRGQPPPAGRGAGLPGAAPGVRRPHHLAGSRWAWDLHGHRGGRLPDWTWTSTRRLLALVPDRSCRRTSCVDGVHDVSDGRAGRGPGRDGGPQRGGLPGARGR